MATPTLDLKIGLPAQLPPPEGANYFQFAVSGPEVEMLIGFIDVNKVVSITRDKAKPEVVAEITHRLFLSVRGFQILQTQINEIIRVVPALRPEAAPGGGHTVQ